MELKKKRIATAVIAAAVVIFTLAVGWFAGRPLIKFVSSPDKFRAWVESHGIAAKLAYIGMVFFQVVIAVIPGEPFEMGGGYAFGTVEGTLLALIGIVLGSAVIFLIVRTVGIRAVEVFFPLEKIRSVKFLKDTKRLNLITFIVFLIPGTPKDLLSYFIGLTDIDFGYWLFVAGVARIPSVITSAASGDALGLGKYTLAVIFLAATAVISLVGIIYYKRISSKEAKKSKDKSLDGKDGL